MTIQWMIAFIFRPTLMNEIHKAYENLKLKLQEKLTNQNVSVTIDIWTDRTIKSYIGITAHYVEDWTLRTSLLACDYFAGMRPMLLLFVFGAKLSCIIWLS